jgi:hypothetical protein
MSLVEEKLIDRALELGLVDDLIGMMTGESQYADEKAFKKMDMNSSRLRGMALSHLQFMKKFGYCDEEKSVKEDGYILSSYPEYFKAWKLAGCPGISISKLEKLLEDRSK